jgi:hypothetical protein
MSGPDNVTPPSATQDSPTPESPPSALSSATYGRRRSFVAARASPPEAESLPPADKVESDEDDLPVLTEVVSAEAAVSEDKTERIDETQVTLLASEIAHAFGQQLTNELPTLLEAALLNAGEELRAGIASAMETALRDFIARRKQLHLPLDEPDNFR